MDAAETYFLELGYERTSLDIVAKSASVSKLTIYSHFSGKEELFKAVIERKCEQHSVSHGYLMLAEKPIAHALEEIGVNFVNLILSDEAIKLQRVLESEAARDPTSARLFFEAGPHRVKAAFCELLKVWQKQKQLAVSDYNVACDQFYALMKGDLQVKGLLNLLGNFSAASVRKHVRAGVAMFLDHYGM